jgi:hypothetical protein
LQRVRCRRGNRAWLLTMTQPQLWVLFIDHGRRLSAADRVKLICLPRVRFWAESFTVTD